MEYLKVKNWEDFQHYKDRTPPWIKLYNHLLDDFDFSCLPDASKAHLLSIWLLASRTNNKIPNNPKWIGNKINATESVDINSLIQSGFIEVIPSENKELQTSEQDASKMLHNTEQDACTEREERESREEESREELLSDKSDAITVLNYLNEVCSSKYKHTTKSHIENINARLAEGHTIEDCKLVIDTKHQEWANDKKMAGYLRPSTLFSTGKFQGYLTQAKTIHVDKSVNAIGTDFSKPKGWA
jgi:uncharacterized phage protein (TIGR02220 family)